MKVTLKECLEGMSCAVRWVARTTLALTLILTCYVPVGLAIAVWVYKLPSALALVWSSVPPWESKPNKKRTPKKSQPWQRLDDFDDVRVRVSELTQ